MTSSSSLGKEVVADARETHCRAAAVQGLCKVWPTFMTAFECCKTCKLALTIDRESYLERLRRQARCMLPPFHSAVHIVIERERDGGALIPWSALHRAPGAAPRQADGFELLPIAGSLLVVLITACVYERMRGSDDGPPLGSMAKVPSLAAVPAATLRSRGPSACPGLLPRGVSWPLGMPEREAATVLWCLFKVADFAAFDHSRPGSMLRLVYGWRKGETNGFGHDGNGESGVALLPSHAMPPLPDVALRLGFYAWIFRSNYCVSRNLIVMVTLCWVALPVLNSCYNEFSKVFVALGLFFTLLRVAAHHLLPSGPAHLLVLGVAGVIPVLAIFGMLAFLRSFTFSWRLSTEGGILADPGLWAGCQYNSSPEVHLLAWQTLSFWLPVEEFVLGLLQAATFHAHPFLVACDVVLQAGILLLVFHSSRLVLDETISPVALVALVAQSMHVAGWLLSLRLNEPTVATWHARRAPKLRPEAPPLEDATGGEGSLTPQPRKEGGSGGGSGGRGGGSGGSGSSGGGADHDASRRMKFPTVDGWLEERNWRARASTCTEAYLQVLQDVGGWCSLAR